VIPGRSPLRLTGALVSGFLLVLAFPSPDLGWLAWVALVPLLLSLRGTTPGQAFRLGAAAGLVAYGGLMAWIRVFGLPAWILLSMGMAAFLGAFAMMAAALARQYGRGGDGPWVWIVPVSWTAMEVVRSVGPLGFPWGLLGLTQYRAPAVLTLASFAGVLGISAVIALANATLAEVLAARRVSRAATAGALLTAALLVAPNVIPRAPWPSSRVAAAIQPNVAPVVKADPSAAAAIIDGLLRLTERAHEAGAEIIVYPETAIPIDLSVAAGTRVTIARTAGGASVVAGAFLPGPQNGVVVIGASGETLGRYAKQRLVPFGEAGVLPGVDGGLVMTPAGAVGLAICYESAFTDLIRPLAAGGAEILAVLTNDGWFGRSAGPAQHAAHAVVRAAETGRSVVRAANTGTSMLIRPDGTVVAAQPIGSAGVLVASLPVGGPRTPYVRWGWVLGPVLLAGAVLAASPLVGVTVRARPNAAVRLALAVAIPGAVYALDRALGGRPDEPRVVTSLLVLIACLLVARGTLCHWPRIGLSAAASLVVTAVLLAAMRAAYAQYGFTLPVGPADGRWPAWLGVSVLAGTATEAWLRGAVFGAALPVGGWPLAVVVSTVLGVAMRAGQPQEIAFWHLFTCVGFGAIRLWTRDALGLGPARGVGDAVVLGLLSLR
jgi:apolipoprotein N-acyltransferase